MCMERCALHRMAFLASSPTGALSLLLASMAHEGRSPGAYLSRRASHTGSLYLPLGRLLIRL